MAELAVARQLLDASETLHYGDLTVDAVDAARNGVVVRHRDGRAWDVELEEKEASGIVSSCGDEPKTSSYFAARRVRILRAASQDAARG